MKKLFFLLLFSCRLFSQVELVNGSTGPIYFLVGGVGGYYIDPGSTATVYSSLDGNYYVQLSDGLYGEKLFVGYLAFQNNSRAFWSGSSIVVSSPLSPASGGSGGNSSSVPWEQAFKVFSAGFGFVILPMTILIVMRKIRQGIALGGEI